MNAIILAFTLKGQEWNLIKDSIERVAYLAFLEDSPTVLIHGFLPRKVVLEKSFPTDVIDALDEFFPIQLNLYKDQPLRSEMAVVGKALNAKVYIIGEVKEGVAEEEKFYKENGMEIIYIPLTKEQAQA